MEIRGINIVGREVKTEDSVREGGRRRGWWKIERDARKGEGWRDRKRLTREKVLDEKKEK